MFSHIVSRMTFVALATLVAGCSSARYGDEPSIADLAEIRRAQNVVPSNPRADIIAYMRNYLNDPTGVRSAGLSAPALKDLPTGARYVMCMRYDPRKSGGGYAGVRTALVVFVSGRLDRVVEPLVVRETRSGEDPRNLEVREACKDAVYGAFPELEAMTR